MNFIIFVFLISMICIGFLIWITAIHNKVNELVDEVNKIKTINQNLYKEQDNGNKTRKD
jgi:hypothetical protein